MKKPSQTETVLKHLRKYGKITTWEAITRYRITRLSGRIFDLCEAGYNVKSKLVTRKGKTFAEYSISCLMIFCLISCDDGTTRTKAGTVNLRTVSHTDGCQYVVAQESYRSAGVAILHSPTCPNHK